VIFNATQKIKVPAFQEFGSGARFYLAAAWHSDCSSA